MITAFVVSSPMNRNCPSTNVASPVPGVVGPGGGGVTRAGPP